MVLRDPDAVQTELDKLALIEPDEDVIEYMKFLIARGDHVAHVEVHLTAIEGDYPTLDTSRVRLAVRG